MDKKYYAMVTDYMMCDGKRVFVGLNRASIYNNNQSDVFHFDDLTTICKKLISPERDSEFYDHICEVKIPENATWKEEFDSQNKLEGYTSDILIFEQKAKITYSLIGDLAKEGMIFDGDIESVYERYKPVFKKLIDTGVLKSSNS